MPESKKYLQPEESVDWAERLRASMSEEDSENLSIDTTDDDLASLLRAQLAKGKDEMPMASSLDISEFEAESEEITEEIADEEDYADEPTEEIADAEDYADEPTEELDEADYVEEPTEELDEADYVEEPTEEITDTEDYADELAEEIPDTEDYTDELAEEITDAEDYADELAEEIPDEIPDEEDYAAEDGTEPLSAPASAPVVTDGLLNSDRLSASLTALDEENARLLEEEGVALLPEDGSLPDQISFFDEEGEVSPSVENEANDLPLDEEDTKAAEVYDNHDWVARVLDAAFEAERAAREADAEADEQILPDDPMQLGFGSHAAYESAEDRPCADQNNVHSTPTPDTTASEEKTQPCAVPLGGSLYTERMSRAGDEATEERDTDLYLRLGYEEDLKHAREQERIERLRTRADAEAPMAGSPETDVLVEQEYAGRARNDAVELAYSRAFGKQLLRFLLAIFGATVAIVYESVPAIPDLAEALTFVETPIYPLLAAAWLLLACIPFVGRIRHGLSSLFAFQPARYSVIATAIPVVLLQTILSAFSPVPGEAMFVGATLAMLAVAALSELIATAGEQRAFSVVSAGKPVAIMTSDTTPAAVMAKAVLPAGSDRRGHVDRSFSTVVRTGRLSDYFARTNSYNPYMARLNYLIPVALLAAIIVTGISIAFGADLLTDAPRVLAAVYLSSLPGAYLLAMSLPLSHANRRMARRSAALVGAAAVAELGDACGETVIFADGDALTAVNRKEITLRDDPEAERWRHMAAEVFHLISSPLAAVMPLTSAELDGVHVEIAESGEGYVKLYLLGSRATASADKKSPLPAVEVLLGTHDALVRRGVRLPKASMEQAYKKSDNSRVLYLAFDRRFRLAYAAEYRPTKAFANAVATLSDMGRRVAVYTYDPALAPSVLDTPRMRALPRVELLRPAYVETRRGARSACLVCTGRATDIVLPLVAASCVRRGYNAATALSWVALIGAVGLCAAVACSQTWWLLSSATVAGWHLAWTLLALATSLLPLRRRLFKQIIASDEDENGGT